MKKTKNLRRPLSLLELLIAINGGTILVLEIVGSRLMAPFFGTSIYIWTAIIGVILLSLSVGYWYGGKLADKHASKNKLAMIFAMISLILALALSIQPSILSYLSGSGLPLRLSAFVAAFAVYAVPATLMGFVSPYITKLSIKSLKNSGETVGRLYAAGTVGSIIGTFLSGYWLTGYFSNEAINWSIVGIYVILALVTNKRIVKDNIFLLILLCVGILFIFSTTKELPENVVYQKDTPYARYQVLDTQYKGELTRMLITDKFVVQSGIFLNKPDKPAFDYIDNFVKIAKQYENPKSFLIVGGGAYTLPLYLSDIFPEASIDVVEIDGELEKISKDYFNYVPTDKITNIVEDGRTFLNQNEKKYDIIFMDAFTSNQPPYQLSTVESFIAVRDSLSPSGIVALNTLGSVTAARSGFISAINRTFSSVFSVSEAKYFIGSQPNQVQNLLFVGSNGVETNKYLSGLNVGDLEITEEGILLTDSFAPTERLLFD